jgi:hypothetical protein
MLSMSCEARLDRDRVEGDKATLNGWSSREFLTFMISMDVPGELGLSHDVVYC